MKTLVVLYACVIATSGNHSSSTCPQLGKRNCRLFDFITPRVCPKEFRETIATGEWLGIYTTEIGQTTPFGKSTNRWSNQGRTWRRETRSFNQMSMACETLTFDYNLVTTSCGLAELRQVDGSRVERFYSQDLSRYFWWFICITPAANGGCDFGFFDLQIRDNREGMAGEINLNGLPWDKISADLKLIQGKTFDDPLVRYAWLGTEC